MNCVMIDVEDTNGVPCKIYAPIDDIKQVILMTGLDKPVDLTSIIMN